MVGMESKINWFNEYHSYRQQLEKPASASFTQDLVDYWQHRVFSCTTPRKIVIAPLPALTDNTLDEFTAALSGRASTLTARPPNSVCLPILNQLTNY